MSATDGVDCHSRARAAEVDAVAVAMVLVWCDHGRLLRSWGSCATPCVQVRDRATAPRADAESACVPRRTVEHTADAVIDS
jgi:hypothetical protein